MSHALTQASGIISGSTMRAFVFGRAEQASLWLDPRQPDRWTRADFAERRAHEREFLARECDVPVERVVALDQVHGDRAWRITPSEIPAAPAILGEGDALFTSEPDTLLVVRTADCLPVFFEIQVLRPNARAVGMIHAGWRGLAAGVVKKTIRSAFASVLAPSTAAGDVRLSFFFGPCVGGAVYEVGPEVAERFAVQTPRPGHPGKFLLDLYANAHLDVEAAVLDESQARGWSAPGSPPGIVIQTERRRELEGCTITQQDRYFSHRGGDTGRNLNAIVMRAG